MREVPGSIPGTAHLCKPKPCRFASSFFSQGLCKLRARVFYALGRINPSMVLQCTRPHRLVVRTSRCGRDNPGSTPGAVILNGTAPADLRIPCCRLRCNDRQSTYTWPGSNWRPSACEADVIATRPQVLLIAYCERQSLRQHRAAAMLSLRTCVVEPQVDTLPPR